VQKCRELKLAPSFHNGARSILLRNSPSNFCFNHIGHFASAATPSARDSFRGRDAALPDSTSAFLEGGVGWACMLYADLVATGRRHGEAIKSTHPSNSTRAAARVRAQVRARGGRGGGRPGEGLDETKAMTGGVEDVDDYFRCKIEKKQDLSRCSASFYFGCEADDSVNAWAFNKKANPMGARLNAIFSSDIGHFDVPDMADVVPRRTAGRARLIDDGDFKDFHVHHACGFWAR